jgi:hypothetical protein
MVLLTHIVIALTSIIVTSWAFFVPSQAKLRATYVLAGLTLVSGTFLVVSAKAHLVQACATGLVYLAIVSFGIVATERKLASANATIKRK